MRGLASRRTSGFTLVEVLVVIGIIGLLVGLMFPVITSTRASTRRARCESNLKQLYVAFQLYTGDWGKLPCPGGLVGDLNYWAQEGGGGIDPYLKNRGAGPQSVYCCPAYTGVWRSRWSPRTYGMNSFLREPADVGHPDSTRILSGIRQSRILMPSRTILLYEGIPADSGSWYGEGYVYRCGNWECVKGYYAKPILHWQDAEKIWHRGRNNYLMCDGRVVSMPPERYPFPGPTRPANNLWYARLRR